MNMVVYQHTFNRLNESNQKNPIRWMPVVKTADNEYTNQTVSFKCKDYLNDFVIYNRMGKVFSIYGMRSDAVTFKTDGGLDLVVYNLGNELTSHLDKVIIPFVKEKWDGVFSYETTDITGLDDVSKGLILHIPVECLSSTFRISLITLMIRALNYNGLPAFTDYQSFLEVTTPETLWEMVKIYVKKHGVVFPTYDSYTFFLREKYNSSSMDGVVDFMMHDAGCKAFYEGVSVLLGDPCEIPDEDGEDYEEDDEEDDEEEA